MARTVSISRRLTLLLTGGIVLLWMLAATLSFIVMREEMDEVFDSALEETAQWLLPLAAETLRELPQPRGPSAQDDEDDDKYLTFQLRSRDGAVLLRSRDAPQEPYTETVAPGFAQTARHRVYTAESGAYFIQVAEPLTHRHEAVMESTGALLLPLAGLVPISIFLILWSVRGGLAPMRRLQSAIGARGGGNLQPIAETDWPEEIGGTVQAVNRLLQRLRSALEAERVFAATSAHELRTPVATALAQTQRLLAELETGPSRARGRRIEATLHRLGALVEKLLHLSRAEAGVGLSETENDLIPVLRLVIEELAMEPEMARRLSLNIADGVSLQARMDIDAFSIVVRNLIENALAYGDPDTPVEIVVPDDRSVRVLNACPPVPPEMLARLTQRFVRGFVRGGQIKNETDGSGLGLAIVETILQQTGGTLELFSPVPGQSDGFEARVTFSAN